MEGTSCNATAVAHAYRLLVVVGLLGVAAA